MSILINMAMPTSCRECWLKMNCDDCEGWECYCLPLQDEIGYLKDLLTDKRRDDCPLVPVPPHGDLTDRDAYRDEFMDGVYELCSDDPDNNRANAIIDLFDSAPSVIQAEPPKEEE